MTERMTAVPGRASGCERCGTDDPLYPAGVEWWCSQCIDEVRAGQAEAEQDAAEISAWSSARLPITNEVTQFTINGRLFLVDNEVHRVIASLARERDTLAWKYDALAGQRDALAKQLAEAKRLLRTADAVMRNYGYQQPRINAFLDELDAVAEETD